MDMKCNKETETSFYHLDCILGKCKNKCSITDLKSCISKHYQPKQGEENFLLSYVFEKVMTYYFNKKSKVCFYDRVTRVDKKDTLLEIIDQLQHLAQNTLFIGALLHSPTNETTKYIYHLSDDTNHNCVFTFCVVEDIILNHPEVIEQGILVLRSDNCDEQYKNRKTFYMM